MKIGIEAQRLFRNEKHGMDIVILNQIKELQKLDDKNEYIIFSKFGTDINCLKETSNFKVHLKNINSYALWEQFHLGKSAKKQKCDLLHCTANTGPLFSKTPLILTIHDVIYLESNPLFSKGSQYQKFGNYYRKLIVPKVTKNADCIITVSESEKSKLKKYFPNKDIRVVYNGVSELFSPASNEASIKAFLKFYDIPEKYILFFGNTAEKKNTSNVLKAYSQFIEKSDEPLPLIMPDLSPTYFKKLVSNLKLSTKCKENILLPGYIKHFDLPKIYSAASMFLYPSLRESFGLPILESMACGTPVITSNISSMPEIAGDAALLVDPYNPESIANAMLYIQSDTDYQNALVEAGLQRAKIFSWTKSAMNLLSIYKEIFAKS